MLEFIEKTIKLLVDKPDEVKIEIVEIIKENIVFKVPGKLN